MTESDALPGLRERARGAYLGLAVGDALGATTEFMTPNEIRERHGVHRDIIGGGWLKLPPGQVTDDTAMSLALGEAILTCGTIDAMACAQAFDNWMRTKPADIGNTVRRNLVRFRQTGEPRAPESEHDAGNGAAMRMLPAALFTYGLPPDDACTLNRRQAHVTHHSVLSDAGCDTLLAMLHDLLAGVGIDGVAHHADALAGRHRVFAFRERKVTNPSGFIGDTLQVVFQGLFACDAFEPCLIDIVNRGGDADTTGAIAGMLAGAAWGEQAIPSRWLVALDADIRAHCIRQADDLLALALAQQRERR